MAPHRRSPGLLPDVPPNAPTSDLFDECFPDSVSLVAGMDADVEDVGGVVKDTDEYVAHYLVVNLSYPGAS